MNTSLPPKRTWERCTNQLDRTLQGPPLVLGQDLGAPEQLGMLVIQLVLKLLDSVGVNGKVLLHLETGRATQVHRSKHTGLNSGVYRCALRCAQVCTGVLSCVYRRAQVCSGVHRCVQVCSQVCSQVQVCPQVCTGVYRCALRCVQVCTGVLSGV